MCYFDEWNTEERSRIGRLIARIGRGKMVLYFIIGTLLVGIGSQFIWGPDNPIEQGAEEVIYEQLGQRIDLSPEQKP